MIKKILKFLAKPEQWARKQGVVLGKNTFVADKDHWPKEAYLIKIGDNCQITSGVRFFTHGGAHLFRKTTPDADFFGKINVGDWCYIGARSLIMPGVSIGNCSIVAAGSVVTKSVPDGVVVGGNPAKVICTIDDFLARNKTFVLHTKKMSFEEKKKHLLSLPDDAFIQK